MGFLIEDKDRLICPMCKMVVTDLVPLYDNDQKHKNTQCCVFCKRKIKAGKSIKKFNHKDVAENIAAFTRETFDKPEAERKAALRKKDQERKKNDKNIRKSKRSNERN